MVFSPPTNKQILSWGLSTCVDGACLPVKAFVGHSQALARQGIDLLFVPRTISVFKGEYTCPNFLGLPDLVRQYLPHSLELLSPVLDGRKSQRALSRNYWRCALRFAGLPTVKRAWEEAVQVQRDFDSSAQRELPASPQKLRILVLGPRYLTDDPFLNGNLYKQLEKRGAQVYTVAQVSNQVTLQVNKGLNKRLFWSEPRRSIGALEHFMDGLDGVVSIAPFGCGAESLVGPLFDQRIRAYQLAKLELNLDEHSGEVGMVTRLEAFCDLLERKKS